MGESVSIDKEEVVVDPIVLYERALVIADISDITKNLTILHLYLVLMVYCDLHMIKQISMTILH